MNNNYDKYGIENDQFFYDESTSKSNSLKYDSELFNDEDYVPGDIINVKRISKLDVEDWQILLNNKEILLLKGTRFSAGEKKFLRTIQGINFIIDGIKQGWKSVSEFKRQIKDVM